MTIEPVIETGWTATSFRDVITAGRRLLLRPQRAGRVRRVMFAECGALYWTDGHHHPLDTRAQAAQARPLD